MTYDPHYASVYDHEYTLASRLLTHPEKHFTEHNHMAIDDNYLMPDKYYLDHYEHDYRHRAHPKDHYWDNDFLYDSSDDDGVDFSDDESYYYEEYHPEPRHHSSRGGHRKTSHRNGIPVNELPNELFENEVAWNETPIFMRHHIDDPLFMEPVMDPFGPPEMAGHPVYFSPFEEHHDEPHHFHGGYEAHHYVQ